MYSNKKGTSNTLIAILIVVALMIVITGTIIIIDGTQKANQKTQTTNTIEKSSGLIELKIAGPTKKATGTTGLLTINIE
jgi:hypothetical protein